MTFVNLANALAGLGKWPEAQKQFQKAIAINPHDQFAYYDYGLELFKQNEVGAALSNFDLALEVDPTLSFAWAAKARLLARKTDRSDDALRCFDRAIELDPHNAALRLERTRFAEEAGE